MGPAAWNEAEVPGLDEKEGSDVTGEDRTQEGEFSTRKPIDVTHPTDSARERNYVLFRDSEKEIQYPSLKHLLKQKLVDIP